MRAFGPGEDIPSDAKGAALALGNFDGVHLGHQAVIASARAAGARLGAPLGVGVFEPHPRRFFAPDGPPFRLQSAGQRNRALESLGVANLYTIGFDRALAQSTDRAFAEHVLRDRLKAAHVSVGADFHFGRGRMGNAESLRQLGAELGFSVDAVAPVLEAGVRYSSSRIRDAIGAGDMATAAALIGRPWAIEGEVRRGFMRGRALGFATANVGLGDYVRPRFGVYAVRVGIDGVKRPGVASLGLNPTFDDVTEPVLEAHVFDFDADLYGRTVEVELVGFIRGEVKFTSTEALSAQIARDVETAKALLA
jgi:riboflavin kinase/FMN adenylyltransferase